MSIKKRILKRMALILLVMVLFLFIFYLLVPLPDPLFKNDYSTVIMDENGDILRAFLNDQQQWYFPPDPGLNIPGKLEKCILMFEDRHFYSHPGVNPFAVARALWQMVKSARIKSGASTLTMQVVRLSGKNKRNLFNKVIEMFQAIKLETRYTKKEILHMYVNHAPYGGNIIGYHAAALKYFKKKPDRLTWSEAATLAILPNSPGLISPTVNHNQLVKKRNRLLKTLLEKNIINNETYCLSQTEPVPQKIISFFNQAPHLAQTLVNQNNVKSEILRTTIIKEYQERVEHLMNNYKPFLKSIGIKNSAALIVETKTGKVRAYVGSQDFFDNAANGQVDGIHAPRSTGSILKPFLYALAIDEGIILPNTLIRDIPSYFGSFSPSNANEKFSGLVTAKNALIRSLNIPAVRLLNTYGVQSFYFFLQSAGMTTLFRNPEDYGLTLILGGAEATLYDVTTLYAGLANCGKFRPLQLLYSNKMIKCNHSQNLKEKTFISPGACYLTLEMLKDVKRPGAEYYWDQYQDRYPIAWKTGTSYGQRDAWAVGVTPKWTIGVWVGNFSGEGNSNLSGAKCAAPLMFDIFNSLPKTRETFWFKEPSRQLKKIKVCLDTGFAACPDCEKKIEVLSPISKKPLRQCPYHKHFYVTLDEKYEVCSLCWEPNKYRKITRLVYPADISQYLRDRGMVLSKAPSHKKGCEVANAAPLVKPIKIIYPVGNAKLWIPHDFNGDLQYVTFKVAHREREHGIYWYIDDVYKGITKNVHKMATRLDGGWHKLEVVDENGNRDWRKFYVSNVK